LRLFELGASAGLNLQLDRYGYDLGGRSAGQAGAPLLLKPDWTGAPPPDAPICVAARAGVDLNPVDPVAARERLLAYVWPDQEPRLRRLGAALDLAAAEPPHVEAGDAGDWLEARLNLEPEAGVCRVVMHTVAFQYFPADTQQRIKARLVEAGARASQAAPLAWLRLEKLAADAHFSLRLRCWPGEGALLAWSHPHCSWIEWL
jgi:hypothetical protein